METQVLSNSLEQSEVNYATVRTDALEATFEGEDAKKTLVGFSETVHPKMDCH